MQQYQIYNMKQTGNRILGPFKLSSLDNLNYPNSTSNNYNDSDICLK